MDKNMIGYVISVIFALQKNRCFSPLSISNKKLRSPD